MWRESSLRDVSAALNVLVRCSGSRSTLGSNCGLDMHFDSVNSLSEKTASLLAVDSIWAVDDLVLPVVEWNAVCRSW